MCKEIYGWRKRNGEIWRLRERRRQTGRQKWTSDRGTEMTKRQKDKERQRDREIDKEI